MIGVFTNRKYQQISSPLIKFIAAFYVALLFFAGINTNAQTWPADTIHVQINTNNPAFPFPQFLEYQTGKSLAANNAVGVTHADMEKAMREAYQIMMHRALKVPGKILNGVQYMQYNNNTVPQNYGTFVSEGDGYALLAAAYFADKPTFDGLWAWVHDNRLSGVTKYYDCLPLRPGYTYGSGFAGWECTDADGVGSTNINSAADGDVDIAMALLIASKQWPTGGINDGCGNLQTYKSEALKMIKVMVDTLYYTTSPFGAQAGVKGYMSGIVGIDGYIKSGNTWGEVTTWRSSAANTLYPWAKPIPDPIQVKSKYVDYNAPAYFEEFANFLAANGGTAWEISQYRRCAASADWIIGQMYNKGFIASSGDHTISDDGSITTFGSFAAGEDFRLAWRTILNYVWHGNPATTWNPATHQIVAGANTFEYDMALRHKEFLKFPNSLPSTSANAFCSKLGASPDPGQPNWKGVAQIKQQYAPNGSVLANYGVNWMAGTGMSAAVASNDIDLTAELYRQCELAWDDQSGSAKVTPAAARYINSTPKYFHGWFRTLGMLTASGNLHAPEDMVAGANMKVYMDVDKTFAYEGDIVNYEVSYRNYGAVAATAVNITTTVDPNYQIVSAAGGAISGNTITWSIGTVPGFVTGGLAATKGVRTFVVRVKPITLATVVCLTSTVTSSNAPVWVSNEYPNNATYTMERNCVDLLKDRVLAIEKTTDRTVMNPGDIVNFTLNFENKTGSNLWLNGGRDRVILSYANYHPTNGTSFYQFYRIWHSAQEAYIDLGNYRVSYFMNDGAAIGKYNAATNPTGWDTYVDNQNDLDKYGYNPLTLPVNQQLNFTYQKIPWGSDANGAWNQRVITQFAHVLSAPSTHIFDKLDSEYLIHKGVVGPGFTRTRFESKPSSNLGPRIADDWSYSPAATNVTNSIDGQGDYFYPVTPSYTNSTTLPRFAPVAVTNYSKDACGGPVQNFAKVLFEEFDGYTWRRVAGNGPLPGRETYNVVVTDSIPIELSWSAFTDDNAVGITATYTALAGNPKFSGYVKWSIPVMLTGETGNLSYKTIAKSPCAEKTFINAGWIWSDVDSPDSSAVNLRLTCNPVPPTPPIETSLVKTADKTNVVVGDVINYTLTFTNKDGSTASWAGASTVATDWQTLGTGVTIPKLNTAVISLDQNGNNAPGTNGYSFGPKKAHGVNGWMEATIAATNSSNLSFLYRYQSPTQNIRLEVSPNIGGNNNIAFYLYQNGSTTPFASLTGLAFPGSSSAIKIRTQLLNDKLYIWVNDFSGAPLKVISGITQLGAGFAGIYGNGSQQALSAYTAHFDSAFDLVISDAVPAQLNNITNYSTAVLTGSTLTWPTVAGPVLANDVIVRTFTATVNTCTDFITNIGKASVYGVTNIQSQNVVICGSSTPPCSTPTTPVITGDQTICTGTAPAMIGGAVLAGGSATGTASYIWESSLNGTTGWATVSGATLKDYTPAILTTTTHYRRIDTKGACSSLPSNVITIAVTPLAVAGIIAADQTICTGTIPAALTGSVSTGGITIKNYKWQSSLTGLAGSWLPAAAYSTTGTGFTPSALTTTTYYRRIDSSGACAGVPTNTIVITVTPTVTAGTISAAQTICSGATPTALTGTVSTGGVTVKNYKWQNSPTGLANSWLPAAAYSTTGTGFAPGTLTADTYYRRIDSSGVCAGVATNTIKITVTPTIVPSVSIATPSTTICTGTSITFTATPTNGGTPTYQWYKGTSPSGISLGAAATNATYTTTTAANNDSYYVVMTSTAACASPAAATSNAIVITVTTAVTPAVTITAAPGNTICAGTSVTFTAVAGNGGLAPTYEWFVKKTTDATPQSQGAASTAATTFTSTTLTNGDKVSVLMTSNSGCVVAPGTATSNIVTMTVNPNVVPIVTIATPSTTICTGTSITFTATPTNGGTPTYQWFKGTAPTGTSLGAASTNNTYTTATAANGDSYYVVMTSTANCASPATATSNAVVITVTTVVTPAVSITAAPGNTICAGTSVTFTASPGNGGSAPTYQWFINNIPQGAATTTAITFTSTTLATGDQIKVIMTSNSGCVIAPGTATSNVITMTVNAVLVPAVAITVTPTGAICPGTSITFTAAPTNGGTPTYVWRKNGTPITPAATGATYTTTTAANNDSYDVVMTSTATCATPAIVTSNAIAITVTPVPTLAVSIVSDVTSICANNPVQFTATSSGTGSTPAPTYEWFVTSAATATGGTSQGAASTTATTFTTSALTAANNRVYVQVVSNATCAATTAVASNVIAITVNAGIGAGTVGSDQSICYNTIPAALTQTVAPTSIAGTPTYQWEASLTSGGTFTAIPAATNIGYTAALAITQDVYIRRVITDPGTPVPCNVATSNTVHITVRPQLVAGVIGSDQTICSGSVPAVMTETTAPTGGTGTFTYQWQSDASGPFQNISGATNSSYTSTALTATTRFQRIETSGTCGSVTSNIVTKTISAPEVVTVSINDPGQVCDGSAAFAFVATAATTGTGTLSYAWTLNNGAVGTNSANYSYTPVIGDDNKTVKVVVTTSNGCNSGPATSNPVTLDIVGAATPTVTITTNNNPNCAGLISTFTATSTGGGSNPTYQWYVDPVGPTGPVAVGTGGTTYSTSTLANGDQVYVELTSNLGCLIGTNPFASNKITMVIKPIPAPAITEGDQTICTPNSFTFHGIVTAGNAYEWRDLSSNTVVGTSPDFPASQSGTYVLFEDNGTCNSTSQPVTLNVIQTPVANAGSDIYIREGDAGSLNGSGGAVYSWSPSTYLNNAGVSNPGFTATETITYTLTVSDASNTCSTTDNVTVTVVSPIIVPNIITVNGDGSNDDWYLKNIEGYPNCIIEIYNRWGNLVWKSEGYPKNWDGTNFRNGQVLPDGTYFYIINLQSQIYDEPLTGWVQIVK